jgi:hypothetical protein
MVSENINTKISENTNEFPLNLEGFQDKDTRQKMKRLEINKKKPSQKLIIMINDFGHTAENLKNLVAKIMERGHEEGFSNFEIILLARELLRHSLTRRQLNYWFTTRRNLITMKEESSSLNTQIVHSDSKKGKEESYEVPLQESGNDDVPLQSTKTGSDAKENMLDSNTDTTIYLKAKSTKPISYLELVDLGSIDCTNHPMYQKAHQKIVQLTQALIEKKDDKKKLKEEILRKI